MGSIFFKCCAINAHVNSYDTSASSTISDDESNSGSTDFVSVENSDLLPGQVPQETGEIEQELQAVIPKASNKPAPLTEEELHTITREMDGLYPPTREKEKLQVVTQDYSNPCDKVMVVTHKESYPKQDAFSAEESVKQPEKSKKTKPTKKRNDPKEPFVPIVINEKIELHDETVMRFYRLFPCGPQSIKGSQPEGRVRSESAIDRTPSQFSESRRSPSMNPGRRSGGSHASPNFRTSFANRHRLPSPLTLPKTESVQSNLAECLCNKGTP